MSAENLDTERIITEVRGQLSLWDLSDILYKDRDAKLQAWTEVCRALFSGYDDLPDKEKQEIGSSTSTCTSYTITSPGSQEDVTLYTVEETEAPNANVASQMQLSEQQYSSQALAEASPHLYTRKFSGLQGKKFFEKGWREVAVELNQLPNGSVKTPEQWITTLQHEVEAGVEMVEVVCLSQGNECQLLETERNKASPAPQIIASGSRATTVASPAPNQQQVQEITLQSAAPQITERGSSAAAVITTPPTVRQESPRRIRNLNPRRSTAEQANIAREDFLAVAKSNADSMRMLAEAANIQAEAARMQAEAAKVQAEAFHLLAQAVDKIVDLLVIKNNK
ncbi:unnamed protein product [Parnassius apollo]|uniref:(apollo) hypothetical protein n=1 Tax=Parnassius apollo TaxID=110799 RepID=A0A8S3W2D7_PARAO|nr:unnamed protein product [Parnassius apollo]